MARLAGISPVGVPVHLIQRGNNRHTCFSALEDYSDYVGWLKEYSKKYAVDIHAWVLMTNHVHLLCTPQHLEYLRLGETKNERMKNYRALFSRHVEGDLLEEIRSNANKWQLVMTVSRKRFRN